MNLYKAMVRIYKFGRKLEFWQNFACFFSKLLYNFRKSSIILNIYKFSSMKLFARLYPTTSTTCLRLEFYSTKRALLLIQSLSKTTLNHLKSVQLITNVLAINVLKCTTNTINLAVSFGFYLLSRAGYSFIL